MQYYNKKTVGVRIRQLRKDKCLTQSRMSELLKYTNERQLQRIESGETSCTIEKLMEIAQILDISTDYFRLSGECETWYGAFFHCKHIPYQQKCQVRLR